MAGGSEGRAPLKTLTFVLRGAIDATRATCTRRSIWRWRGTAILTVDVASSIDELPVIRIGVNPPWWKTMAVGYKVPDCEDRGSCMPKLEGLPSGYRSSVSCWKNTQR